MSDVQTYVRLLETIRAAGVMVRTGTLGEFPWATTPLPGHYTRGARPCVPGEALEGPSCRPTIVVRGVQTDPQQWFRAPTNWRGLPQPTSTAEEFASAAVDPVEEAIVVAHEFGHHLSAEAQDHDDDAAAYDEHLERSRLRLRREIGSAPPSTNDADLVYEEERHAWMLAREVLGRLRFAHFQRLEELRRQSLATCEDMIRRVLPGWSAQEPINRCLRRSAARPTGVGDARSPLPATER